MNWTEGRLARHSRARQQNALLTRQKQHFAKVRNSILNSSNKPGHIAISFMKRESSQPSSPSQSAIPTTRNAQGFSSFTPLGSHHLHKEARSATDDADDIRLLKRRKLLGKSDWAGLAMQEPLDVDFPGQFYSTKRWGRYPGPSHKPQHKNHSYPPYGEEERTNLYAKAPMRIQIGSEEVRPSLATGSLPSIRPSESKHESLAGTYRQQSSPGSSQYASSISKFIESNRILRTPRTKEETPAHIVYSSSMIHAPRPQRVVTRILDWSDSIIDSDRTSVSEDRGSMQVEIERPTRPVPVSQESEQREWKKWLLSDDDLSSRPATHISSSIRLASGSGRDPRSSTALPSHLQRELPPFSMSSDTHIQAAQEPQSPYGAPVSHCETIAPPYDISGNKDNQQPNLKMKKQEMSDDLNEIWKRFVCIDDEDTDELFSTAFKEAAHQAAKELRPSETPDIVDTQTDTGATCGTEPSMISESLLTDTFDSETSATGTLSTQRPIASEAGLSNKATVGSSDDPPSCTVFTMPKSFAGKNSNANVPITAPALLSEVGGGKRRRRKQKRNADGRTDIRRLPDFEGDPIEDSGEEE
ncbi:hypothetical protein GGR57DRAFT_293655 [Xylariaceae sp. FL1272]|nr:hypothetical protein GGR57DRAFT_293655 [Xylariaceae sp. FL1272]